ncbi:hypothetical protein GR204_34665 [Rhizobium leguminosarum]|uniref:Uncharacterized protein n=1 Tax=Rhizobium leguminosarum TaxID=384 RepID=A0A6P0BGU7_RHILE|nr:hypothetical protein [Rhizobium leguminosarum]NEI45758.1 hypothetical protein [Rhizobium leguminosarum]
MEHDGEDDRLIDVVEPAGSDSFAVNKLGGKQVVAPATAFPSNARLTFNLARRSISTCSACHIC